LKPESPARRQTLPFAPKSQRRFCEIARTETQTSPSKRGPHHPPKRTVRSFNFSRLARSTCCQRPRHLTPERGDSVGVDRSPHPRNSRHTPQRPVLGNPTTLPRFAMSVNPRFHSPNQEA